MCDSAVDVDRITKAAGDIRRMRRAAKARAPAAKKRDERQPRGICCARGFYIAATRDKRPAGRYSGEIGELP